ncbi:uncharacterized protein LOC133723153 [Rosa rugosa]|uniref:uncharacterized protein LOC133723153 n=1 Tax=Rosa rugosa TaxID=74645 RepID=UPI002B40A129|nr:uncharacterized protein LOC133723153 [Rosa rugosa]
MRTMFISHELWSYVDEGYTVPEIENMSNAQKLELKTNIKKDAKALGILQNSVSDEIFPRISNEETAKAGWDVLLLEFKGSEKVRAVKLQSLRRDFEYTRMNEIELLNDYSTRLTDIVNQMKTYGESITEKRLVQKILMSLNRKYDAIKGNQQANCIEEQCDTNMFSVSHAATTQVSENVWLVDSACSNHMTANPNLLYDIDYNSITKVKMENGMLVDTKGKGSIAVETKNDKMFIRDVMLVPNLDSNLLSVGQLIEHSYHLHFGDNTCKIFERGSSKKLMVEVEMKRNICFPLTLKYATESARKMELQDDPWLWHRRLGHLNFQSLKQLHQK